MFKSILLGTILLSSVVCNAQSQVNSQSEFSDNPALKITSISISELENPAIFVDVPAAGGQVGGQAGEVIAIIDGIMAIGEKVWKIVDAGRPVIRTQFTPSISALPEIAGENGALRKMANWSVPKARSYRISYFNGFNMEVVAFTYSVYFQFNGSYQGKGKYITNLKVQASDIYSAWGFSLDAASELVGIANVGSATSPVASAIIQIAYGVRGLLNEVRSSQSFYVDGVGNVKIMQ